MDKVMVTGANGFVGRHLLKRLLREGVEVYAVVRSLKKMDELSDCYDKVNWITGDLYCDTDMITEKILKYGGGGN